MLRVWKISGEELLAIEKKDMRNDDISTLKTLLRSMYGFPVNTQTLVLDGCSLEPHCRVRFPSDLQLILSLGSGYLVFWHQKQPGSGFRRCMRRCQPDMQ